MTEALLQKQLNVAYARPFGAGVGGCISVGHGYDTDIGKIFVKENRKDGVSYLRRYWISTYFQLSVLVQGPVYNTFPQRWDFWEITSSRDLFTHA